MKARPSHILLISVGFSAGILTGYWVGVASHPVASQREVKLQARSSHYVRPWLGMNVGDLSPRPTPPPDQQGVVIVHIAPGSPADRFGLHPGDVILSVDGEHVVDREHFPGIMTRKTAGKLIVLDVVRDGNPMQVQATPADWPG